ncbi:MAG: tyrosine-type recombinase/integrase [Pyrinomonadaceae bacterium]
MAPMLEEYFRGKTLREVTPQLIEQFKNDRLHTSTKCPMPGADTGVMRPRAAATVNRELSMLSSIYSLAIKYEKAESNPCEKVGLLSLDNQRYRYLLPDEEESLMEVLTGPREHLKALVIVAIGTGMRQGEQFSLKRHQVDFFRGIVTARKTKNGRDRDIPMNSEVRSTLADLCKGKGSDDLVFTSPRPQADSSHGSRGAFRPLAISLALKAYGGMICGQHSELGLLTRVIMPSRSPN